MREDEVYALFGALLEKVGLIADGLSEEVVAALRVGGLRRRTSHY